MGPGLAADRESEAKPLRFSGEYRERLLLGNGIPVAIRLVRPTDAALFVRGFERLSTGSRYHRFFGYKKALSPAEIRYFTECDGVNHFALGAVVERADGTEDGAGVARFVRLAGNPLAAEAAVTVVDAFQRYGLGRLLFDRLLCAAEERGVRELHSLVLAENKPMLALLRKLGPTVKHEIDAQFGARAVKFVVPVRLCTGKVEDARFTATARMPEADSDSPEYWRDGAQRDRTLLKLGLTGVMMRNASKTVVGVLILLLAAFIVVEVSGGLGFLGRVSGTRNACERGNAFACYKLATMYEIGQYLSVDLKEAELYYRKACSMDTKWGCEEAKRLEERKGRSN